MKHARILLGLLLVIVFAVSSLSACNTVRGIGRDVEKTGQAMQKGAD